MNLNSRNKKHCQHDLEKVRLLLEKKRYQEVIDYIDTIDILDDLWYTIEAYLGLQLVEKAEKLLAQWRYRISNLQSESYWLYYGSLIKKAKNNDLKYQNDLKKALEIATNEKNQVLTKKILQMLKE